MAWVTAVITSYNMVLITPCRMQILQLQNIYAFIRESYCFNIMDNRGDVGDLGQGRLGTRETWDKGDLGQGRLGTRETWDKGDLDHPI